MIAAILSNGFYTDIDIEYDILICADGGANHAMKYNLEPDYIVGDMDSITNEALLFYKDKCKIKQDNNQEKTDTEIALELAQSLGADKIIFLGAIGSRLDHTIANVILLYRLIDMDAVLIDEYNEVRITKSECEIEGCRDDIVSIIPLETTNLSYENLKWEAKKPVNLGWLGICNIMTQDKAWVNSSGAVIVIKQRKNEPGLE